MAGHDPAVSARGVRPRGAGAISARWPTSCRQGDLRRCALVRSRRLRAHLRGRGRHHPSRRLSVEGDFRNHSRSEYRRLLQSFEAARRQGVGRVVFASSNHAVGFYRRTERIDTQRRVRPDGLYGMSKAYGEALGSLYADKHGLRVMSIRIGNVGEVPLDERRLAIWIHPEDLVQLCRIGLEHQDLHCEIVYGASDNDRAWWDNHNAYALGYAPKHRSEDHVRHALDEQAKLPRDPIGDLFQGGGFCSNGFTGDLDRL
ncbi:MAG: NAD(P)-dependent oxidoreductase [Geminicoccaceae bacterium]